MLERLQSSLLHNDKSLELIDTRREELKRISNEEENKIAALCTDEVQGRVSAGGENLKTKLKNEFNKINKELTNSREAISKDVNFTMEMNILLERLQSTLLHNDKILDLIDTRREELKRICHEEENNIAALCTEVQGRVSAAGENLKTNSKNEFNKINEELTNSREAISKDSLV